jgi:tetratricopeptide (TPR) repeat protein
MRQLLLFITIILSSFSAYAQNSYLQEGDRCFEKGDYLCAQRNYNNAFQSSTGKNKQIAETRLTRTKSCIENTENGNLEFNRGNYKQAKDSYQKVLDTNSNDSYAKSQIEKCNSYLNSTGSTSNQSTTTTPNRVGSTSTLSVSKTNVSFPL